MYRLPEKVEDKMSGPMTPKYMFRIQGAIGSVRGIYGSKCPRNMAERKSLINWIWEDVLKKQVEHDEVERAVLGIIGEKKGCAKCGGTIVCTCGSGRCG